MVIVLSVQRLNRRRLRLQLSNGVSVILYAADLKGLFPNTRTNEINEGFEFPEDIYLHILRDILPKRARLRAMNLLIKKDYTKKQLSDKLAAGEYPIEVINNAVDYVCSYGYVDDERYARSFAEYRLTSKSRRQIEIDLLQKGVDRELIRKTLDDLYEENSIDETELIEALIQKKTKNRDLAEIMADEKEKSRLIRFLMSKGYSYEKIMGAIHLT